MVVITIGDSSSLIRIGDNATAGSGIYEWYIDCTDWDIFYGLRSIYNSDIAAEVALFEKVFDVQAACNLRGIKISTYANFEKINQAISTWESTDDIVYPSMQLRGWISESANHNLLFRGTKAAPTGTTGWLAKIAPLKFRPDGPNGVVADLTLVFVTA